MGQDFVKRKAVSYLEKKLHTKISIGSLSTNWLHSFELNNFYLEDQQKRTLVSIRSLKLKYNLLDLLNKRISVSDISFDNVQVNLYRNRTDSLFNFSFIPAAFASNEPEKPTNDTSGSSFAFDLGTISLKHISFNMDDAYGGQKYIVKAVGCGKYKSKKRY